MQFIPVGFIALNEAVARLWDRWWPGERHEGLIPIDHGDENSDQVVPADEASPSPAEEQRERLKSHEQAVRFRIIEALSSGELTALVVDDQGQRHRVRAFYFSSTSSRTRQVLTTSHFIAPQSPPVTPLASELAKLDNRPCYLPEIAFSYWLERIGRYRATAGKPGTAAARTACRKWLKGLMANGSEQGPPKAKYMEKALIEFPGLNPHLFREAWKAACDEVRNENWGKPGRPRKIDKRNYQTK